MPFAAEAFGTLGEVVVKEGRAINADDVRDADILAVRSTTRIDQALLEGSSVRFVGTATIGTDHIDIDYLQAHDIPWCFAPGCNANSVSEYIVAALLSLAVRNELSLAGLTLGVVGVGNVGRRVVHKAEALGLRVLQNDPPRERSKSPKDPDRPVFVPLDQLLTESDIITMHVPLTRTGRDATWHLANRDFFARVRRGCIFINAARGAVTDTDALLEALDNGTVAHTVIDTWEGEPHIRADLLQRVDIGTQHIAGHSFEGKVQGTVMVYESACRALGITPDWSAAPLMPPPPVPRCAVVPATTDEQTLWDVVRRIYDIEDDARLLSTSLTMPEQDRTAYFDHLRKDYRMRREFSATTLDWQQPAPSCAKTFAQLGFVCS